MAMALSFRPTTRQSDEAGGTQDLRFGHRRHSPTDLAPSPGGVRQIHACQREADDDAESHIERSTDVASRWLLVAFTNAMARRGESWWRPSVGVNGSGRKLLDHVTQPL
jgi:hypothetical protein